MTKISSKLHDFDLQSPIMTASGCAGYGKEMRDITGFRLSDLGAFVCKSVSYDPISGNPPPRLAETTAGLINSIGLQNDGIEYFLEHEKPILQEISSETKVIVSIFGSKIDEFFIIAEKLADESWISAIEVNVSCPNHEQGGLAFGVDDASLIRVVKGTKKILKNKTMAVKLTPNCEDITHFGQIAVDFGADILVVANTFLGMSVDWRTGLTGVKRGFGGLSGPAVKPMIMHKVHQVRQKMPTVPIIASGGASNADDVLEYLVVGADAVQIGTAFLRNPKVFREICDDLNKRLEEQGISDISMLKNTLKL
ncbi:MAG: dihydroorotate dehydrogenase [Planctomycetes bacterium]|nr:dihydroorotate dehydrogenase [Planctomycetota bacterium]